MVTAESGKKEVQADASKYESTFKQLMVDVRKILPVMIEVFAGCNH